MCRRRSDVNAQNQLNERAALHTWMLPSPAIEVVDQVAAVVSSGARGARNYALCRAAIAMRSLSQSLTVPSMTICTRSLLLLLWTLCGSHSRKY